MFLFYPSNNVFHVDLTFVLDHSPINRAMVSVTAKAEIYREIDRCRLCF